MAITTLLNLSWDDPRAVSFFAFEHDMAHRTALGHMGNPDQWSVVPYLLDPMEDVTTPVSSWHLDHQQAHNDLKAGTKVGTPGQILRESNLANWSDRVWWTFVNHHDHYLANALSVP